MLLSRRNNLFDEFFNDPFFNDSVQTRTTLMRTDIEDDGTNYIIDVRSEERACRERVSRVV